MRKNISIIQIDREKCIRCGACIRDCIVQIFKPGADGVPELTPDWQKFCLNCQHCLTVCPAGAVICNGVRPEDCGVPGEIPDGEKMQNLIRQRRSIRQFKQETLSAETLEKLKDSLRWMPTGCNDHRLHFAVVSGEDMEFFREESTRMLNFLIKTGIMRLVYPNYKRYLEDIVTGKDVIFRGAPHMIVCSTPKNAPCAEADPWIALSYFDLLAHSMGAGTLWCGFAMYLFRFNRKMRNKLGIPKGYRIGSVLLFGVPDVTYARVTSPEA